MPILSAAKNLDTKAAQVEILKQEVEKWADVIAPILDTFDGEECVHIFPFNKEIYLSRENEWLNECVGMSIQEIEPWYDDDRDMHNASVDIEPILSVAAESTIASIKEATTEFRKRRAFLKQDPYLCGKAAYPYFADEPGTAPEEIVNRALQEMRMANKRQLVDDIKHARDKVVMAVDIGNIRHPGMNRVAEARADLHHLLERQRQRNY